MMVVERRYGMMIESLGGDAEFQCDVVRCEKQNVTSNDFAREIMVRCN